MKMSLDTTSGQFSDADEEIETLTGISLSISLNFFQMLLFLVKRLRLFERIQL